MKTIFDHEPKTLHQIDRNIISTTSRLNYLEKINKDYVKFGCHLYYDFYITFDVSHDEQTFYLYFKGYLFDHYEAVTINIDRLKMKYNKKDQTKIRRKVFSYINRKIELIRFSEDKIDELGKIISTPIYLNDADNGDTFPLNFNIYDEKNRKNIIKNVGKFIENWENENGKSV